MARSRWMHEMSEMAQAAPEQNARPSMDQGPLRRLRARMRRPDVAPELFYPLDVASWRADGLALDRAGRVETRSQVSGVRFHAADPAREDLGPERLTQRDATRLVATMRRLREEPGCEDLTLSSKALRTRRPSGEEGRRVKFGLASGGQALRDPIQAANAIERSLRRAIHRSGFLIREPKARDKSQGFDSLEAWANQLLLARRRRKPWWVLFLLPLLFLLRDCDPSTQMFGVPVEDRSLLLVLDTSSSMGEHFEAVRAEAKRLLDHWIEMGGERFANIVVYDSQARSALGGLKPLNAASRDELLAFLDGLQAGGGTNLKSGLEQAAAEVEAHEHPVTMFILTDASDSSIEGLNTDFDSFKKRFGEQQYTGHALTPRLFQGGDRAPVSDDERRLATLAGRLGGQFGPAEEQP